MSKFILTNRQQAFLMFLAFVLPPVATYATGLPNELGILVGAVLSGSIAFIKEILGWTEPKNEPKPT